MSLRQAVQDLSGLPEELLKAGLEAILEQAGLIRDIAQVNAHVKTGSYRDSIRVERGGIGAKRAKVFVRAGGYVVNPKTGKLVNYAVFLEKKYHTVGNAFNEVRPQIADVIKRFCLTRIKHEEVNIH